VHTHVYYNAKKAVGIREVLYSHVATLREQARLEPTEYVDNPEYKKYLIIRKSEKEDSGYTVNIRQDVVDSELETAGWLVIISNFVTNAKEALTIYREKDVVEKGFLRLKNSLDLARIRVHSETNMQNKVFVCFIALILLSAIRNVMMDKNMYKKLTMRKLILTLSKVKVQFIEDVRILSPLTKQQRGIFKASVFCDYRR